MPNEIHSKFIKGYGDSSPLFSTIKKWAAELKRDRTSLEDDPCERRPKSATPPEIIEQVHNMVLDDWRMKVHEIAETIGVSKERVGYILLDGTSVRLLYLRASRRNSEYTSVRGLEVGEEILVYVKVQLE